MHSDIWLAEMIDSQLLPSLALVVSVASLAFTLYKGRYDQIVGVKPAIVFIYDGNTGWQIQNIGSGPALNIIVAESNGAVGSAQERWSTPVRVPPLKKDGIFTLHWNAHTNTHGLAVTYEDMWQRVYTTKCGRDLNKITRGCNLPRWDEAKIQPEWTLRKS